MNDLSKEKADTLKAEWMKLDATVLRADRRRLRDLLDAYKPPDSIDAAAAIERAEDGGCGYQQ